MRYGVYMGNLDLPIPEVRHPLTETVRCAPVNMQELKPSLFRRYKRVNSP